MPHTSNTPSGASFKPINQTPDCVTPPSPSERAGVRPCDNNASKCDNNVSIPTPAVSSNVSQKPAAGLPHVETTNASHPTHYHTSDFLENVTTSRDAASPSPSERAGERSETELEKMIKLPPEKRTSPFRIGNILWVNNIDDVDERYDNLGKEWGERKMGDIIRRYSTYGQ